MLFLYSVTLFLSATLLFWVQPMFGKMILPFLGSTPSVWNTCMCFFQGMLLIGYVYSHVLTKWLGVRKQAVLHLLLLLVVLFFLPIHISNSLSVPTDKNPVFWLLFLLSVSVGIPFFTVSTTAPLLQKWFSNTSHIHAKDPYFLYASSNLGSIFALVGYIVFLEPNFRLVDQNKLWTCGYYFLAALILACAVVLWRASDNGEKTNSFLISSDVGLKNKISWVLLSFVPSSLLLSVTTYLSTDIAAIPLIWVLPLVIYLLTFVIAFSKKPIFSHELMVRIMPILVLPMVIYLVSPQIKFIWLSILSHLLTFFVLAMVCHGELVRKRPQAEYLTEFYLCISLGGFLGGIFNALIAPLIFKTVFEYPLGIILACFLRPGLNLEKENKKGKVLDYVLPIVFGIVVFIFVLWLKSVNLKLAWLTNFVIFGLPAVFCFIFSSRPVRFGLSVAVFIFIGMFYIGQEGKALLTERSFFGVHRVILSEDKKFHRLVHGRTVHGAQKIYERNICEPLTYYHRTGPIGQLFKMLSNNDSRFKIGAIGLGAGSLACYGKPEQSWTFYEIDPVVEKIASNKNYFTFLTNSQMMINIALGDGRLSIKKSPDSYFDLIILDAFSSDSIPVHLITKEAIELYFKKLVSDGILAFHISNQYLNLKPVLGNIAQGEGLVSFVQEDLKITKEEKENGKEGSIWVVMTRNDKNIRKLFDDRRWQLLSSDPQARLWSDDFSNILSVFKWRR